MSGVRRVAVPIAESNVHVIRMDTMRLPSSGHISPVHSLHHGTKDPVPAALLGSHLHPRTSPQPRPQSGGRLRLEGH
jgi:hypothetical protein